MGVVPTRLPKEAKNKVGVLIGLACSGRLVPPEMIVAMGLQSAPTHFSTGYLMAKGLPVDKAREYCAEEAIRVGAKYLWFVDDDTIPPPNTLRRLVTVLENYTEIGAIGGVYVTKSDPTQPVVFRGSGLGSFWQWKYGDIFEVTSMGAGCLLIKTEVFEKIPKPWFTFIDKPSDDPANPGQLTSEDVHFCNVARDAGYLIFAHGGILCDHYDINTGITYQLPADSYPMRVGNPSLADPLPQEIPLESPK